MIFHRFFEDFSWIFHRFFDDFYPSLQLALSSVCARVCEETKRFPKMFTAIVPKRTSMNIFGNPQGVTYRYICLHVSSEGRSPEARWRSQTEAALRDRLIYVASGIFTYITI